ncbi:hypothetical protein ES703_89074 [subsurface metagenome]
MDHGITERIIVLEGQVLGLQQQIEVLQEFTGLRETLEHNIKKAYKESVKASNKAYENRKRKNTIEIAYVDKKGFMRVDYVRFKSKKECEKMIKEKCPTAEIVWNAPNKVFVTEQYSKNKK